MTVRDAEILETRLDIPEHNNHCNCACQGCRETRAACPPPCRNPHECHERAQNLLNSLPDKWNPLEPQPEDYEDEQVDKQNGDEITFDMKVMVDGTISDIF
ncbi:hypothetical protein C8J56DRAFT_798256 [Mycena floridula]|nr:hypothetical protein C8J56DRAFT_798256 [Mycena floridula]